MAEEKPTLSDEDKAANARAHHQAMIPYHLALGSFVNQYSILESILNTILVSLSGVTQEIGKAIYSGTRIGAARDFINRILESTNQMELKERMKPYFDRVGLITSARDEILHYGASYKHDLGKIILTNSRSAHVERRLRIFTVEPDMLRDLESDTKTAYSGLLLEWLRDTDNAELFEILRQQMTQPWRYKPPQLILPEKNNTASGQ